jgi:CRISPR-associated protein Csx3
MKEHLEPKIHKQEHLSALEGIEDLAAQTKSAGGMTLAEFLSLPENKDAFKYKKILVGGPAKSGKTVFNKGIKDAIVNIPGAPYPLIHTAAPDGEGSWFAETMNNDPELAARLKAEYKRDFTPEFVKMQADAVKKLGNESCPLNFIDLGGQITPENAEISAGGNAAVILCGETALEAKLAAEWKIFFNSLGIPVIAELYSDFDGKEDLTIGIGEDGVFRGSVHHLDRSTAINELKERPTIKAFAEHALNFEKKDYAIEAILNKVNVLIEEWQKLLPEVDIVLGGSLVSGLLVLNENTKIIDVDLRFLTKGGVSDEELQKLTEKIESVTGLKYKKTIEVADWPGGVSEGILVEGKVEIQGIDLPLDIEGCLRNEKYIGWAKYYKQVLSEQELEQFKKEKIRLGDDKVAYKALKQRMVAEVQKRCLEKGLVSRTPDGEKPSDFFNGEGAEEQKTYHIYLDGDILRPSMGESSTSLEKTRDALSEINRLIDSGELSPGRLIKINGAMLVFTAATIIDRISGMFEVVAVFDPDLNEYVVTSSKDPALKVGDFLSEERQQLPDKEVEITEKEKAYHISIDGDILKPSMGTPSTKKEIARDALSEVNRLIDSGELSSGDQIKINGRLTVSATAVIIDRISGMFDTIAIFDPKIGGHYVVVVSKEPSIEVGTLLKD